VENTELIGQLLDKINDEIDELDAIMYNKYTRQPEGETARLTKREPRRTRPAAGEETADAKSVK